MKFSPRIYDLVTVLGLMVILVWTPVHLADGNTQAPPDGHTFSPPGIRDGDRIEYELIVQEEGETAASTGAFVVFEYRRPLQGEEAPNGTVLIEERTFQVINVDLGPAVLTQDEHVEVWYYDDAGELIGAKTSRHRMNPEGQDVPQGLPHAAGEPGDPVVDRSENLHPYLRGPLQNRLPLRGEPIIYNPGSTWEALTDLFWSEPEEPVEQEGPIHPGDEPVPRLFPVSGGVPEDDKEAPFAAHHQSRILYAMDLASNRVHGAMRPADDLYLDFDLFDLNLDWKREGEIPGTSIQWSWWAEDLPVQAGAHFTFVEGALDDEPESVISFDVVPASFEAGAEAIPLEGPGHQADKPESDRDDVHPWDDPDPIIGSISLARIHDDLQNEAAPDPVRAMMEEDPLFVGVLWETLDQETELLVALLHANATKAVHLRYAEDLATVQDACGQRFTLDRVEVVPECAEYPLGVEPRSHGVGIRPPSVVLPELRAHLDQRTASDASEYGAYHLDLVTPIAPEEGRGAKGVQPLHIMFPLHDENPILIGHRTHDTLAAVTGSHEHPGINYKESVPTHTEAGIGATHPLSTASSTVAPEVLGRLGPEPIYGGLVLAVGGILTRFLLAVKSGGHLPLFSLLYAKITKDKALQHKNREAIAELVAADPGVSLVEVTQRTGLSRTGAYHHLDTLVRNELLHVCVVARERHFFPADWKSPTARARQAVARRDEWEKVLRVVEANPGLPLHDLVEQLDVHKSAVSRTGSRLAALGLIRKEKHGREVRFYPVAAPEALPVAAAVSRR